MGGQRTAPATAHRTRTQPDPLEAGRLLRRRHRRPAARIDPARGYRQTWWPAVLVAVTHDAANVRTEGFNRIIKQVKRVGCGYRNLDNYQRRTLSHIAVNRPLRSAAQQATPLKFEKAPTRASGTCGMTAISSRECSAVEPAVDIRYSEASSEPKHRLRPSRTCLDRHSRRPLLRWGFG